MSEECEICTDTSYIKHNNNRYCSPKLANCITYNTSGEVLTCAVCDQNYYFNIATGQCLKNPIYDAYCSQYNSNQECEICFLGFYYNSVTKSCDPNDKEYNLRSRCQTFNQQKKNECSSCGNNKILMKTNYTCKIMDVDKSLLVEAKV